MIYIPPQKKFCEKFFQEHAFAKFQRIFPVKILNRPYSAIYNHVLRKRDKSEGCVQFFREDVFGTKL
jgi:hypothetical protein